MPRPLRTLLPSSARRRVRAGALHLQSRLRGRGLPRVRFTCNVCGRHTSYPRALMGRETPSCGFCGSSVRFRTIVRAFTTAVMGTEAPVRTVSPRPRVVGLGFSDDEAYAPHLSRCTTYTNSWFHQPPRRDVQDLGSFEGLTYDYLVCSDVLEHINRPVATAFDNLHALLNPGGVLILSIPTAEGITAEHYPELSGYTVDHDELGWVLRGTERDGTSYEARDLVFHGGPGSTLEMRVFGRESVNEQLTRAGFVDVQELDAEVPSAGLVWTDTCENGNPPGVWVARKSGATRS